MRLLDTYATNTGSRIDKPFIYTKFFPIPLEKYITFQAQTPYDSRNYSYWQEVIYLIHPYLSKNNITIIQVGLKEEKAYEGVSSVLGQTNLNQLAYVIERGLLHFGADSLSIHLASHFNKPIVGIYSISNPSVAGPHFGDDNNHILLKGYERIGNKKPSYSQVESPKSIDTIKPEEIANGILKLLNIRHENLPDTIYIGQDFRLKTFELIPDDDIELNSIPIDNPIIRMDYYFNQEVLEKIMSNKRCIIFTDKPIKKDLINKYKKNISQLIYIIDENNDPNFVKILKNNSINYVLLSFMNEYDLNKYKLEYMDYNLIINKNYNKKEDTNILNVDNLYYKSSRIIHSSKGRFISKYDWINNTGNKVIDDPEFWKEIDNFYIFKLDENNK